MFVLLWIQFVVLSLNECQTVLKCQSVQEKLVIMNGDVVEYSHMATVDMEMAGKHLTSEYLVAGIVPDYDFLLGMDLVE
jgi:hypothetical protein